MMMPVFHMGSALVALAWWTKKKFYEGSWTLLKIESTVCSETYLGNTTWGGRVIRRQRQ